MVHARRSFFAFGALVLASGVLLGGCSKGGALSNFNTKTFVAGQVLDANGNPIPGAKVNVVGSDLGSGVTDGNGVFNVQLKSIPTSGEASVSVTAPGFTTSQRRFQVIDQGTASLEIVSKQVEKVQEEVVTSTPSTITVTTPNDAVEVVLDSSVLGQTGNICFEVTCGNPKVERDIFPGDFVAVDTSQPNGETGLSSIAFTEVKVTNMDTGQEIENLAGSAQLTVKIPEGTINPETLEPFKLGDLVPIWSFDEATGLWVRGQDSGGNDIDGTVVAGAGGALCAVFDVPHFSWWNMDYPMDDRHCLTGKVVNGAGNPVPNAAVTARGVSQNYEFGGFADSNGNYSFDVFRGTVCEVFAQEGGLASQVVTVNVPDVQSSINDSTTTCTPVANLVLADGTCISGKVLDTQGNVISGAYVEATGNGVWANVDANGEFCLEGLAISQTVTVKAYVIVDGLSISKEVVVTTGSTPSRCIDNNCVTQDIIVAVDTACIAGEVTDLGTGQPISGVGVWSEEGPWTTTGADGRYCIPATKGATVLVAYDLWDPATGITYSDGAFVTASTVDGDCNDPTTCTTRDFQIDRATGTVTGTVTNMLGVPVQGVNVYIAGYPVASTDGGGVYTIQTPIQNSQTVYFEKYASNGLWISELANVDVTVAQPTVTLNRVMDLRLACVQGTVDIAGVPGANVQVSTNWGITTTTDSFGSFCLDVVFNTPLTLTFLEALPGGTYVSHSESVLQATVNQRGSCATGNCVDLGSIVLNEAPVITPPVTASPNPVTSRASTALNVVASDPDGDPLSYFWSAPAGSFDFDDVQSPNWTAPLVGVQTLFTLTVQVSDGLGGISSSGVVITVNPPANNRPVISAMTATPPTVDTGQASQIDVTASDPDGDALTYTWSTPNGGSAIGSGNQVNFVAFAPGTFTVTCIVSDGVLTETSSVIVTVSAPPNRAPVINSLTATPGTVGRGGSSILTVNASDLDGDSLTYTWSTAGSGTIAGSGTTVTFFAPTTPGTETVTVSVSDGALTDMANVNIQVVNTAPTAAFTATPSPVSVGGTVTLNASGSSDPEGDPLTYAWMASSGTLSSNSGLSVTWTAPGAAGSGTITLTVDDGALNDVANTVINVQNLPPVITSLTANPSATFANDTSSVTVVATDPENTTLSYGWSASGGTTITGTGSTVTWDGSSAPGTFTVTVTVTDGGGAATQSSTNIVVGNRPPVADPQSVVTNEDTTLPILLTGSDPDGDPLTFAITQTTSSGTILLGPLPDLTYTPDPEFSGTDSFTFTVNDGSLTSVPVAVTITVNPVNDAPVADAQAVNTDEDVALGIVLTGSDADGDPITFAIGTGPTNGSLSGTAPNVTYTPNADFNGSDSFTFTTNDGTVTSSPATVDITVNPINDPPVITSVTANPTTVAASGTSTITVVASDVDGDTLTYSYTATGGSIPGTTASETWTAPAGSGGYTITANVFDGTVTVMSNVVVTVAGDTTPPTVSVVPTDGAMGVALNATIVATFSEVINTATVNASSFTVNDGGGNIAGAITFSGGNTIATFTPSSPLTTGTTYTVNLTGAIQDTSGNALNPTSTTTFDTATIPPPSITSLSVYSGPIGTVVVVNGSDFDPTLGGNTVRFNGTAATLVAGSTTSLEMTVPGGATTGPVTVEAFTQTSNNSDTFTVLTAPASIDTTLSVSKALSAVQHKFPVVINGGTGMPDSLVWGIAYSNCPSVDRYVVGTGNQISVYEASDDSIVGAPLAHSGTNDELITDIVVSKDAQTAYAAVAGPLEVGTGSYLGSEIQLVTNLGTTPTLGTRIDLQAQSANVRGPIQVAVTPDGARLLALCEDIEASRISGHLVVVDTSTNLVTDTILLPDVSGTTYTKPYRMAIHPSGSHVYVTVDDADDSTTLSTGMRLLTYDLATLTLVGGSTLSAGAFERWKDLAIRPDGASGFLSNSNESTGISFLTDVDFSTPSAPALGTAHSIGTYYHAPDRELVLGLSPDGGMLYVRSHASDNGEEVLPAEGIYNELVKGFDIRGATPQLFDEFYIGATDAFTYLAPKWHFLGGGFLLVAPGIIDTSTQAQQQGVVHSCRVFPAGALADLPPFKGGPSGAPLSSSTMTVFVYDQLTEMPASGVNVSLSNNSGGVVTSGTTDSTGTVQFAGLTGPQNVTLAAPGAVNLTFFGIDAQNLKIPLAVLNTPDKPKITVVINGIPGGEFVQGIETSVQEDNGGDFPSLGDNIRTVSLASNERFSAGLHTQGGTARDRQQFARVMPCSNMVWEANLTADSNTHNISGDIVFPSDIPNGYSTVGIFTRGSAKSMFPAEQFNGGSGILNGGPTTVAGNPMPYSAQPYMVPSGVSNIRWTLEVDDIFQGDLGAGADLRVTSQKASYLAYLDLGPSPAASLLNQDYLLIDAPFFLTIAGTSTGTAPGGFYISDTTPAIVVRDVIAPSGSVGRYELEIVELRPDSQFKVWNFFLGSTDSARISGGLVTFQVPDLPAAVASEALTSTGNRQLFMQSKAVDFGGSYDHDNWVIGGIGAEDSGQEVRSSKVEFDVFLGTSVGTQTTSSATMQQARFNFGMAVLPSGDVLVAGGNTNPGPNTDTGEIYNVAGDSTDWTRDGGSSQTFMSTSRNEVAAAVLATGEVLFAGGGPEASPNSVTSDRYDPSTGVFTVNTTPDMTVGRIGHSAVTLNDGRVLVLGGLTGNPETIVPELEIYDPSTNNWSTHNTGGGQNMLSARDLAMVVVLNPGAGSPTNVLVTGGITSTTGFLTDGVVSDTGVVISVPNGGAPTFGAQLTMSTPRRGHAMIQIAGGDILILGGVTGQDLNEQPTGLTSTVERYQVGTGTFVAAPGLLSRRGEMASVLTSVSGVPKILLIGGLVDFDGSFESTTQWEIYDPASGVVDAVTFGVTRFDAQAIVVPRPGNPSLDRIVIMGGRDDQDSAVDTIEYFDPN